MTIVKNYLDNLFRSKKGDVTSYIIRIVLVVLIISIIMLILWKGLGLGEYITDLVEGLLTGNTE